MPHVVTGRCVDCRYTDCCVVCPSDSFFEITNPAMLVISPDACADCAVCVPECPVLAIYPEDEVPEPYQEWIQKNAELYEQGTLVNSKVDPLPTAITLEQVKEKEKEKGWEVADPSEAEGGGE